MDIFAAAVVANPLGIFIHVLLNRFIGAKMRLGSIEARWHPAGRFNGSDISRACRVASGRSFKPVSSGVRKYPEGAKFFGFVGDVNCAVLPLNEVADYIAEMQGVSVDVTTSGAVVGELGVFVVPRSDADNSILITPTVSINTTTAAILIAAWTVRHP